MERLKIPMPDGGAPYKNQDFYQFLQENHIESYSAFLDEINDRDTGNCGIILKGIKEQHICLGTPPDPEIFTIIDYDNNSTGFQDNTQAGSLDGNVIIPLNGQVIFNLSPQFNIIQVSKDTWDVGGDTPLPNGFSTPYGGGTVTPLLFVEAAGGTLEIQPDGSVSLAEDPLQSFARVFTLYFVTQLAEPGQPWDPRRKGRITIAQGRDPMGPFVVTVRKSYDLRDSLVYIDGEFLEPAPWIASQSQYGYADDTGFFAGNGDLFYIHKCSDETLETKGVEFKTQRFTKVNDLPEDVIKISYFDVSETKPDMNHIEIKSLNHQVYFGTLELQINRPDIMTLLTTQFPGPFSYADYNSEGTTRYFSRILKYYLADEDDLYMTYDLRFFKSNGIGFGPMFGFKLKLDSRFLLGYATGSNTRPWNLKDPSTSDNPIQLDNNDQPLTWVQKSSYENYSRVGNTGGEEFTFLVEDHLPTHNHGGMSGTPSNDMSHSHGVATSDAINPSNDPPISQPGVIPFQNQPQTTGQLNDGRGYASPPGIPWEEVRLAKGTAIYAGAITDTTYFNPNNPTDGNSLSHRVINPSLTGKTFEINYTDTGINRSEIEKDLSDHTHPIYPGFSGALTMTNNARQDLEKMSLRHYNAPPFITIAYYEKYNPYQ